MKRLFIILTGLSVCVGLTASIAMTGTNNQSATKASVTIRHQTRGCHSWSINRGTSRASLTTTLARGGTIRFVNNDVMPHKLVLKSGPALRIAPATLGHMGALVKVTLARSGVYHFVTKAGEDYPAMAGMKTIGEDNVLRLTVTVK